jgi:hypothetical protein
MCRCGMQRTRALSVGLLAAVAVLASTRATIAQGLVWYFETVDATPGVGHYTSLALDGSGWPHVSYLEWVNYDLRYAYRDASGWHIETVDTAGYVGHYTSLALDGSGWPHISYYDLTNTALKYGYRDASGWHTETVDAAGDVGWYTSLALDGPGWAPHQLLRRDVPASEVRPCSRPSAHRPHWIAQQRPARADLEHGGRCGGLLGLRR